MIRELLIECRVLPSAASVRAVRKEIEAALGPMVPVAMVNDAALIVSELCTNAITASGEEECDVVIRVGVPSSRSVTIEVEDCGSGSAFQLDRPRPSESDEAGRGLRIVDSIADHVRVERGQSKTVVRAVLRSDETVELTGDLK